MFCFWWFWALWCIYPLILTRHAAESASASNSSSCEFELPKALSCCGCVPLDRLEVTSEWEGACSSTPLCISSKKKTPHRQFPPEGLLITLIPFQSYHHRGDWRRGFNTHYGLDGYSCYDRRHLPTDSAGNMPCDTPVADRKDACLGSEVFPPWYTQIWKCMLCRCVNCLCVKALKRLQENFVFICAKKESVKTMAFLGGWCTGLFLGISIFSRIKQTIYNLLISELQMFWSVDFAIFQ